MTQDKPAVLMVTRESGDDRRYGLGRSLMPVVTALTAQGWRVRYLCQDDLPPVRRERRVGWVARVCQWPGFKGSEHRGQLLGALAERVQMGRFAAQTAGQEGFGVVYLHDPWLALGFWSDILRRRMGVVRWGVAEHGFGCYSRATHEDGLVQGPWVQRVLRRVEAFVLARAHFVTSPTRLALDQLARDLALPFNPPHWHVIAHAVGPTARPDRALARRDLGWDNDAIVLLGVGRFARLKRFDLLVSVFASLARVYPTLRLQLLGGGDRAPLQRIADAAGVGERLQFAVVDDLAPYYAGADIYVSTSESESFGLANLEALMAGCACVCTAVGGVPEVMGAAAWLVPVDPAALTAALAELLDNPSQRQALAARARARAQAVPELPWVVSRYAELFQE